jgi:electron transfer flavoprotein beta subunit
MPLSIVVCIKPVPASDKATIDPETKTVRRDSESIIGSLDRNALEAAAQLKKELDCTVTVIAMAPPTAQTNLREALAQGADSAVLLSDRTFAGGDTFATSHVLAAAIEKLGGCDLILAGAHSEDGGTCQVPAQLAEWLAIPHLHNACQITPIDNGLTVETVADKGMCLWEATFPVLVSVDRSINKPRAAGLREILAAKKKELLVWSEADLPELNHNHIGLKNSPTQFGDMYTLDNTRSAELITGDTAAIVDGIIGKLADAGVLLCQQRRKN